MRTNTTRDKRGDQRGEGRFLGLVEHVSRLTKMLPAPFLFGQSGVRRREDRSHPADTEVWEIISIRIFQSVELDRQVLAICRSHVSHWEFIISRHVTLFYRDMSIKSLSFVYPHFQENISNTYILRIPCRIHLLWETNFVQRKYTLWHLFKIYEAT